MDFDAASTALVVIDLQRGVVARNCMPHASADVVANAAKLLRRFRERGALVVLVHVGFSADDGDRLKPRADEPAPPRSAISPDFAELVPELGHAPSDVVIVKRQWGAFYGTELDLQLRRRGIKALVLCGIATNFGVESTARDAWERGYELIFVEDAMSGLSPGAHEFAIKTIFPRIGRITTTEALR
ncbi:MAG TPA: hydrolase [Thermoanaerobaculia bacterium]|nr:hydrolase [Thermoanaerobaculia bacterium]